MPAWRVLFSIFKLRKLVLGVMVVGLLFSSNNHLVPEPSSVTSDPDPLSYSLTIINGTELDL